MSGVGAGAASPLDLAEGGPLGATQTPPPGRVRSLLTRRDQYVLRFGGALLLLASALVCVWWHIESLASGPIRSSLAFIPDDAFYYLKIARNIAGGLGPTFDGTSPTNGYHPGWMVILVTLATIVEEPVRFLRSAQWVAFGLHILTAIAFGRLLWALSWRAWAIYCAALWLSAPWGLVQAAQAMEAPLYQLCAALLLLAHVRVNGQGSSTPQLYAWYGVTLGLVVLARTDGALLSLLSLAITAWRSSRQGIGRAPLVGSAALAALIVLPWLMACFATCGTLLQDSAAMKALWRTEGATLSGEPGSVLEVLTGPWLAFPAAMLFGGILYPWLTPVAKVLVAAIGILVVRAGGVQKEARHVLMLLVGWGLGTGLLYAKAVADLQLWHLVPAAIALFLVLALLAPAAAGRWGTGLPGLMLMILVGTASQWVSVESSRRPLAPYPWQVDVYDSVALFDRQVPTGAIVGAFNAGIPGYFSERPVVNLDGLVNHNIVGYWYDRRWDEYLRLRGVTHIADEPESLRRTRVFSQTDFQVEEVASHPLRNWPGERRFLWKVRPH